MKPPSFHANDPHQLIPRYSLARAMTTDNIDLLKSKFYERVISRNGPNNWPPRSCDLTHHFFGATSSHWSMPTTLEQLRNIDRKIAAEMCSQVIVNWDQRIDRCKRARSAAIWSKSSFIRTFFDIPQMVCVLFKKKNKQSYWKTLCTELHFAFNFLLYKLFQYYWTTSKKISSCNF